MMSRLNDEARAAIRARRIEKKYSQPKAAERGGISITTWNSIENGRSGGAPLARAAMCRVLGWTQDSIDRLELGDEPVEHVYPGGPDDPASLAETAAYKELAEKVNEQDKTIARLEKAVRRLAGDQILGDTGDPRSS